MTTSRLSNCLRFSRRFLGAAAGALVLLASGQAMASTVVVAPAPAAVYVRPSSVVVVPAHRVVVKPAPKTYVAVAPLPTVVVKPAPAPRTVYVAAHPVYVVR